MLWVVDSLIAGLILLPIAYKEVKSKIDSGKEKRRLTLDRNIENMPIPQLDMIAPLDMMESEMK